MSARKHAEQRRRQAGQTVVSLGGMVLALVAWWVHATGGGADAIDRPPVSARLQLDLNRASVQELMLLPGIGPSLARRIVDHRRAAGPFASLADLTDVKGIGPVKLRGAAPYLEVSQ